MIIGVNASYLATKEKTGIENFSSQLILNLLNYDRKNTYYLFCSRPIDKRIFPDTGNFQIFISSFPKGWHRFRLPLSLLRHKVDIFFDPGYTVPPFISIPSIAFVHDVAHKYFPDYYSSTQIKSLERAFRLDKKRASAIIFSSRQTLLDFEKFYPGNGAAKAVLYQGYPTNLFDSPDLNRPFLKFDEKYILFVGRIEDRKNVVNLVKAYTILRHFHPDIRHKLVLAGKPGHGHAGIAQEIKNVAKFGKDIIEIGYVPDKDVARLYHQSDLFVYPSWYEGFGIPLLEAFSAGTPVACAKTSSIPEVAGDAAIYFDPSQPEEICQKIYEIISQPDIRNQLIRKGRKRLEKFTWEKYCFDLIPIFDQVLLTKKAPK